MSSPNCLEPHNYRNTGRLKFLTGVAPWGNEVNKKNRLNFVTLITICFHGAGLKAKYTRKSGLIFLA
jgi:hypothetical protein